MFVKLKWFDPERNREHNSGILLNLDNVLTFREQNIAFNGELVKYYEIFHTDNFSWAISEDFYNKIYKYLEENNKILEV